MSTPQPSPTAFRFTEDDRARINFLMRFWDTKTIVGTIRIALQAHEEEVLAVREGAAPWLEEYAPERSELLWRQRQKRMAEIANAAASLQSPSNPLVASTR